jgi:hypothetical protein
VFPERYNGVTVGVLVAMVTNFRGCRAMDSVTFIGTMTTLNSFQHSNCCLLEQCVRRIIVKALPAWGELFGTHYLKIVLV